MRLSRPPRRDIGDENIVPLINIVFLLLVFFILTGTLEPAEPLSIEPPASIEAGPLDPEGTTILIDREGNLALGGDSLTLDAIIQRIQPSTAADIRIKADAAATAGMLLEVTGALRAAGIERIIIVTAARTDGS